ncbi:MAG: ABC transporter ATP-binding protein [Verrucomicrobia bacterium]|nr:ABC transporter ATP-binding protein [Verrucomicrobiota bacterium]
MRDALKIFHFGWPYLRRYWFRLIAGIVLGVLFGISNASFVWATKTLFERLAPRNDTRLIVGTNANLNIVVSTNAEPHLSVADGRQPMLLVSNNVVLQVIVDPNLMDSGMLAATGEYLDSKKEAERPGVLRRAINRFDATVDPWLPLAGRSIDVKQLIGGLLFLPILVAFRGYIGYLSSYCMAWVSERVIRDLRLNLLAKLNTLSMDFFNRSTIGELLMRVNGDTGALYRCLSLGFSDLIKEPVSIICISIALFAVNWKLTLLAVFFTPLTVIPIRILGKKVRAAITSGISQGMMQDSLLVEVYTSIRVVKAFCLEKMQMQRFSSIYQRLLRIGMKSTQARELVNPTVETISMLGLGVVIIYIFAFGVTVPQLIGFLTGVTMIFAPIKKLGHLHVYFQQASVGAGRLVEIFKQQPSVLEKADAKPLPQFARDITFDKVSFAYRDTPVVRNFNFSVRSGMRLGIAGESGSGKSTLVNLIFRFYDPTEGRITIDGNDLRDLSLFDVRQQMALVSQDIVIFDQTVADNITCGREGATREEVEAAAKAASAHDFIMQLPEGYETRVGERGITLSGGQRQRLCIARAFVRNAPILVLDEATASLDPTAEAEVQAAIDRLAENRTVICIAHRLSTLANMDHILVMKDGEIVEQDTFGKLIKANGVFAGMARNQGIYTP